MTFDFVWGNCIFGLFFVFFFCILYFAPHVHVKIYDRKWKVGESKHDQMPWKQCQTTVSCHESNIKQMAIFNANDVHTSHTWLLTVHNSSFFPLSCVRFVHIVPWPAHFNSFFLHNSSILFFQFFSKPTAKWRL